MREGTHIAACSPTRWLAVTVALLACTTGATAGLPQQPVLQWTFTPRFFDPVFNRSEGTCLVLPMRDTNGSGSVNEGDEVDVVCPHESVGQDVVYTVFRGSDGAGVETSTQYTTSPSVLSAGDVDGDGWNEYVALALGGAILAIKADGSLLWQRDLPERNRGAAALSLADIDQDGSVDVVTGRSALLGNGGQWLGTGGTGWHRRAGMSMSVPADVDPATSGLEVACGNTLYMRPMEGRSGRHPACRMA